MSLGACGTTFLPIRIIRILRLSRLSQRYGLSEAYSFIRPSERVRGSQHMYPMANTVSWQASREQVLRFWRAIELFTPPKVPDVSPKERVDRVERSSPLPWEDGHRLRRVKLEQDQVWRHVVYGGVFSLDRVHDVLEDVFGKDEENFDPPRRGESALFALTVTGEGRVLLGSEVLSTCAWAVGRTRNPGPTNPDWLQGFDVVAGELGFAFQRIAAALDDDEQAAGLRAQGHLVGRPMHFEYLERLVEVVADRFGVSQLLKPAEIRVQSVIVAIKRQFDADGQEFLNSFIADDLERVADAVRRGEYGAALDAYLQEEQQVDPARRVDVRTDPQIVLDWVVPDRVPLGRWPASSARPLALSQQFAVNGAMALSGASGLFAVNGPPGTGKTTLLRELVAAIVVERAHRLAALPTPSAAFGTTEHRWQTGEYTRVIKEWTPELTGFEIVVASANNGAVENVTLEIPSADAIDDEWREQAKYFDDLATSLLGKPAWGVVAARLGKKANRQQFANKFWFGERGLLEMLKRHPREPGPDWARAVAEFHRAYQDVAEMREARERASRPTPASNRRAAFLPSCARRAGRRRRRWPLRSRSMRSASATGSSIGSSDPASWRPCSPSAGRWPSGVPRIACWPKRSGLPNADSTILGTS